MSLKELMQQDDCNAFSLAGNLPCVSPVTSKKDLVFFFFQEMRA